MMAYYIMVRLFCSHALAIGAKSVFKCQGRANVMLRDDSSCFGWKSDDDGFTLKTDTRSIYVHQRYLL